MKPYQPSSQHHRNHQVPNHLHTLHQRQKNRRIQSTAQKSPAAESNRVVNDPENASDAPATLQVKYHFQHSRS